MLRVADFFIALLVPFLIFSAVTLIAMLVFLVAQRGIDELQFRRRMRLTAHYRDTVDALLAPEGCHDAMVRLARAPRRHREVISTMLLKPLTISTGSVVERLREAARVIGLIDQWADELSDRRWWMRAEAARALGLVREAQALSLLIAALDDDHEEVRAAAVEALGLIGDPRSIQVLLSRLPDHSRNQRARIIEALRAFGDTATHALVEHAQQREEDAAVIADVLGLIGGPEASDRLKSWMTRRRADVRIAAMRALGTIGLDESGVIVALQALDDPNAQVRAMAARALGRARRQENAADLARHLDDEWMVAANCADALRRMGAAGIERLQARADDVGYVGDLARQMLWERHAAGAGA
jgi:HEAT repeat protein